MSEKFQEAPKEAEAEYQLEESPAPTDTPPEMPTPDNGNNPPDNEGPDSVENIEGAVDQAFIDDIFDNSPNFRQLVRNLSQLGKDKKIVAPDGYVYNLEDQIGVIAQLTGSTDPNLGKITRTFDLRAKVQKALINKELGTE